MISTHFVGSTPLVVGTVYGAAQSPTFRDPLGITQCLLRSLIEEVVNHIITVGDLVVSWVISIVP